MSLSMIYENNMCRRYSPALEQVTDTYSYTCLVSTSNNARTISSDSKMGIMAVLDIVQLTVNFGTFRQQISCINTEVDWMLIGRFEVGVIGRRRNKECRRELELKTTVIHV